MPELVPDHPAAPLAAHGTLTFAEALERLVPEWRPPPLRRAALVQVHCHQASVLGTAADERLMRAMELDYGVLDSGCCGLAGNFGFEKGHYDVSIACAERVMAPAIRAASDDVLVLADGFSCRTQIEHTTGRRALHLAEVVRMALQAAKHPPATRGGPEATDERKEVSPS